MATPSLAGVVLGHTKPASVGAALIFSDRAEARATAQIVFSLAPISVMSVLMPTTSSVSMTSRRLMLPGSSCYPAAWIGGAP